MRINNLACLCLVTLSFSTMACALNPWSESNQEAKRFKKVLNQYAEGKRRLDPFYATYFNIEEDLGTFGDYLSPEFEVRERKLVVDTVVSLREIQPSKLNEKDQLVYALLKHEVELALRGLDLPLKFFSFDQMGNRIRAFLDDTSPELTSFPFDSIKHYEDFISRAKGFPAYIDRQIENLRAGAEAGYPLNCTIAKAATATYKEGLEANVEKNPFFRPVLNFPKSVSAGDQTRLRQAFKEVVGTAVLPALQKFDGFFRNDYMKSCRRTFGLMGVPRSAELYAFFMEMNTDLKLDPNKVHEIGLNEVARIRNEMKTAFSALGYDGAVEDSLKTVTKDPSSYFSNVQEMLTAYANYQPKVDVEVAKDFELIPKSKFVIVESENPEDAAASYRQPTELMPYGRFVINGKNLKATARFGIQTLYIHEAIPGHHFHLALQYEMKNHLTEYQRKMFFSNAFAEGWALYAERWAREVGLMNDPAQMIGSLSDEMLRAVRLVVDTGIHAKGWSRDQVMKYMAKNLPADARDIQIETDRYSVWPGQALGYKIGQLKILELRDKARKAAGAKFNLRDFHRVVLDSGTLSMPVLEDKMNRAYMIQSR
jgi:uncharacterized protein (DUF885 family)